MRPLWWLFVPVLGCKNGEKTPDRVEETEPVSVWAETTVPFDPSCARCEEIGSGEDPHLGKVTLKLDLETDDPVAQWGRCFEAFVPCFQRTGVDVRACVAEAPCPQVCRDAFDVRAQGIGDDARDALLDAFEEIFYDPDSLCGPPSLPENDFPVEE